MTQEERPLRSESCGVFYFVFSSDSHHIDPDRMTFSRIILLLILQATFVGCRTSGKSAVVHHVDPVLSNTLNCEELVDYLNSQNKGLQSWRCMDTQVRVSMPGLPISQELKGQLACSAPSSFRLTADNFVGMADFGSNDDLCWAYVKPGDPVVMTWRHEDAHLLEYVPGDFPRLDPEWLMVILGIQPLNSQDFQIQKPPAGSQDLWLVSIEESANGEPLRRVIKVDTVRGFAREHSLIDHNGDHLLRAQLSNYRTCGGHVIPHTVKISFPPQKTELTLNFKAIEANCHVADTLWIPPGGDRIAQVDLGDYVRRTHGDIPPKRKVRDQSSADVKPNNTMLDGTPQRNRKSFEKPDFDVSDSSTESLFTEPHSPDRRFYVEDAGMTDDLDESNVSFDDHFQSEGIGSNSSRCPPIIEAGHLVEPDFDTVAPAKPKARRFSRYFNR